MAQPFEPRPHIDLPEQALLFLDGEWQTRGQEIGQPSRFLGIDGRDLQFLRNLLALVDHPLKEAVDVMYERIELDTPLDHVIVGLDPADQVRFGLHQSDQPSPMLPLANDSSRAVRELEHLEDQAHAHDRIKVVDSGCIGLGVKLANQPDHPFADHTVVDQSNSTRAVDDQRHHGLRKDDVRSQGKQGNAARLKGLVVFPFREHDELARLAWFAKRDFSGSGTTNSSDGFLGFLVRILRAGMMTFWIHRGRGKTDE